MVSPCYAKSRYAARVAGDNVYMGENREETDGLQLDGHWMDLIIGFGRLSHTASFSPLLLPCFGCTVVY